jgi:hypothetical protein
MSRSNAILLFVLAIVASPAFSADPPGGTILPDEIDPATGLARTTVVRPYTDSAAAPAPPAAPGTPAAPADASSKPKPLVRRPHVALILPTASPALGKLAEAVRAGFMAAVDASGKESIPVNVTAVDNEATALVEACRYSQAAGAVLVVGGFTRDGAQTLATSDCALQPVLALNELRGGNLSPDVFSFSLSLENEARQVALLAVGDGYHAAIVIGSNSALSKRVQDAFNAEWTHAAGELRRITYSGNPDEAPLIREKIANMRGDVVFLALDQAEARAVRPYVSGMLPIYATSLSVNPRAEAIVNVDLQGVRYVEMPWFVSPDHPAVMAYPQPKVPMSVESERLYAFGIDAFRIALLITKGDPRKSYIDGVTGKIGLEERHFSRSLSPAEVDGGRVIPLRPTS